MKVVNLNSDHPAASFANHVNIFETKHYENMPIQYIGIFFSLEKFENFIKKWKFF